MNCTSFKCFHLLASVGRQGSEALVVPPSVLPFVVSLYNAISHIPKDIEPKRSCAYKTGGHEFVEIHLEHPTCSLFAETERNKVCGAGWASDRSRMSNRIMALYYYYNKVLYNIYYI